MSLILEKKITRRDAVFEVMSDCNWHTLAEIAEKTGYSEASVSAQLRDFRKPLYGSWTVEKRRTEATHESEVFSYEYKLSC
jgi:hypothetical protein